MVPFEHYNASDNIIAGKIVQQGLGHTYTDFGNTNLCITATWH